MQNPALGERPAMDTEEAARRRQWHRERFGEAVRDERERLDLSQQQLADRLGKDQRYVSRLESASGVAVEFDVVEEVAAALEVPPIALVGSLFPGAADPAQRAEEAQAAWEKQLARRYNHDVVAAATHPAGRRLLRSAAALPTPLLETLSYFAEAWARYSAEGMTGLTLRPMPAASRRVEE